MRAVAKLAEIGIQRHTVICQYVQFCRELIQLKFDVFELVVDGAVGFAQGVSTSYMVSMKFANG